MAEASLENSIFVQLTYRIDGTFVSNGTLNVLYTQALGAEEVPQAHDFRSQQGFLLGPHPSLYGWGFCQAHMLPRDKKEKEKHP